MCHLQLAEIKILDLAIIFVFSLICHEFRAWVDAVAQIVTVFPNALAGVRNFDYESYDSFPQIARDI